MKEEKIFVSYCMNCGKIKFQKSEQWQSPDLPLSEYALSHGYCDPCADKEIEKIKKEIEEKRSNQ